MAAAASVSLTEKEPYAISSAIFLRRKKLAGGSIYSLRTHQVQTCLILAGTGCDIAYALMCTPMRERDYSPTWMRTEDAHSFKHTLVPEVLLDVR
uniref:Uncharacterized protein n=1 Tax=Odontella aurita TaxID=265563 RepID=A0A7S4M9F7_9STRA